jgi:two-component system, sensor histidine kinase
VTQVEHGLGDSDAPAEVQYEDLFEFGTVGYLVTDGTGTIVEANRAAAELLGVPVALLPGKPIAVFVPVAHRAQFRKTMLGLAHSTSTAEWELELEGRHERRFHAQLTAARALGGGLRWMIQDVTERVATEQRLRTLASALEERVLERTDELEQERARLMAFVEQMPGGVIVAEAPTGRVVTVNEHARRFLGIADGQSLHGIGVNALRTDGTPYRPEELPMARALEGEHVVRERVELMAPDGTHLVLSVSASPVRDRADRITAGVSLLEDMTQREAWERAEREFVTNAAHELQSPLAAITSAVEVLQAGAKEAAERDLFLDHIERESRRLDRLTKALLTLARAQVGVEAPRSELIDVCPLLEAIAERLTPAEGVELVVECPRDLALVSNRELLEQAISNIVRNSVKYTEEGSIRLIGTVRDSTAVIAVRDTGRGIPEAALPRVAQRFYRAESGNEGFGLGLAIVQAALEVLGGKLEIASSVGYGTTVTLTLPAGATRVAR